MDKGISAGENSKINIKNVTINNSLIGVGKGPFKVLLDSRFLQDSVAIVFIEKLEI